MNNVKITSPEQMDSMIKVTKKGIWVFLIFLVALVVTAFVMMYTKTLTSKLGVQAYCIENVPYRYLTEFMTNISNGVFSEDELIKYTSQELDVAKDQYTVLIIPMTQNDIQSNSLRTGSKVLLGNGSKAYLFNRNTTLSTSYDEYTKIFSRADLTSLKLYPGQEYYTTIAVLYDGEQSPGAGVIPCEIVLEELKLSSIISK